MQVDKCQGHPMVIDLSNTAPFNTAKLKVIAQQYGGRTIECKAEFWAANLSSIAWTDR